jgi:hypothetical protein
LGHDVCTFRPIDAVRWNSLNRAIHYRLGFRLVVGRVRKYLLDRIKSIPPFDLVWVDSGELVGSALLKDLRRTGAILVNYNSDDPTGRRDRGRWGTLLAAIPEYDLCVVVRRESEDEYRSRGAPKVLRVWRAADEVAHRPRAVTSEIRARWGTDVAFVGTWMPERGVFMRDLIQAGVPVAIWGSHWEKAPEWRSIKAAYRGPALLGDDYAHAIQCAKFNLGLVSKGNRDLHTTRSSEIPMLGGLFCAERTSEHLEMYREGREAIFWTDAEECALQIRRYLDDDSARQSISEAGRRRVWEMGLNNESVLQKILVAACGGGREDSGCSGR